MKIKGIIVILTLSILLASGLACGEKAPTVPDSDGYEEVTTNYTITEIKDVSYLGCVRHSYHLIIPLGTSEGQIKAIGNEIVLRCIGQRDVNAIIVFFLHGPDALSYTAKLTWAPRGDWGRAGEVNTGHYSKHEYSWDIRSPSGDTAPPTTTPVNMQAKLSLTVDAYIDWETFEEEPIENALMVLNCSVTNVSDETIDNLSISLFVHDVTGEDEFWFVENIDSLAPGDIHTWREEALVITMYFSEIGKIVARANGEEIAVHVEGVTP